MTIPIFSEISPDTGSKTIGTEVFNAPPTPTRGEVRLKSAASNTGVIYVGYRANLTPGTNQLKDGYPLFPMQEIIFRVLDLNQFYAVANIAGQRLFWIIT